MIAVPLSVSELSPKYSDILEIKVLKLKEIKYRYLTCEYILHEYNSKNYT